MQAESATPGTLAAERQFDFWLGDWDLTWGDGARGTNHVHTILDGRVVMENFDGGTSTPLKGISTSVYDANLGKWRQTWVDNQGGYIDLTGDYTDDRMLLTTQEVVKGETQQFRMIFYNISATALDWNWEKFDASAQTWTLQWKIHYQRKP